MNDAILLAYFLYALLSIALFVFSFRRVCDGSGVMRLLICLAMPPVGLIWALMLSCAPESKTQMSDKKDEQPFLSRLSTHQEDQAIPMSEALVMNDHLVCCSMLLNALKDDPKKYIRSIRKALDTGNGETVHYAAAAVMQMRHMLMERVTQLASECLPENSEPALWEEYADALEACLTSNLFDDAVEMNMSASLEAILERLLTIKPAPRSFARMVELYIRQNNLKKAMIYSKEFLRHYPAEEKAYLLYIQCLIHRNDNESLRNFLVALPRFPVEFTQMTLKYIRCLINAGFTA